MPFQPTLPLPKERRIERTSSRQAPWECGTPPMLFERTRAGAIFPIYSICFHFATGFSNTLRLAHMLDSLVRVSRRVGRKAETTCAADRSSCMVSIPRNQQPRAARWLVTRSHARHPRARSLLLGRTHQSAAFSFRASVGLRPGLQGTGSTLRITERKTPGSNNPRALDRLPTGRGVLPAQCEMPPARVSFASRKERAA